MSYAILRTAKLKSWGNIAGSLGHTFRDIPTANADENRTHLNENSHENYEQAYNAVKEKMPEKLRKNGVMCIEYLITASPEWYGWDNHRKDEYFRDTLQWLEEKHGKENILVTSIQLDETTPHLVAYVLPIDNKGKMNAAFYLDGRKKMSDMQTDFAEKVGKKYGLERGKEGSKAEHTTIKQFYDDINSTPIKQSLDIAALEIPKKGVLENHNDYAERVKNEVLEYVQPHIDKVATLEKAVQMLNDDNIKKDKQIEKILTETKTYRDCQNGLSIDDRKESEIRYKEYTDSVKRHREFEYQRQKNQAMAEKEYARKQAENARLEADRERKARAEAKQQEQQKQQQQAPRHEKQKQILGADVEPIDKPTAQPTQPQPTVNRPRMR